MERSRKEELVAELKQQFAEAKLVVVAQYSELGMGEINTLRANIREAGATFKFTKNTLAKLAVADSSFAYLAEYFTGQTAVAFSSDELSAAKVLYSYSKENEKITLIAGGTAEAAMSVADIQALATLPSLDELRGKIVGVLQAPATKVAGVLQAPAGQVARVMGAYAAKDAA